MTRRKIKWIVVGVALLGIAGVVGYQFSGGGEYSSDIAQVKTQFNSDNGKVRLLVLLSPT